MHNISLILMVKWRVPRNWKELLAKVFRLPWPHFHNKRFFRSQTKIFKKEWQELLDTSNDLSARQEALDTKLLKVKSSGLEQNEFIVVKRHVMEQLTESKSLYTHFATDLLLFKEKIPMFLLFILLSMVGILYSNVVFKAAVGGLGFL